MDMVKKGVFSAKAALFLVFMLFGVVLLSVYVVAPLVCEYKNVACSASQTKVLGLSNFTNAHAEVPSQTNYGWNVCCEVQGTPSTLSTTCLGADTNVTGLNSSDGTGITDAHLEVPVWEGVPSPSLSCLDASPNTVLCRIINQSCPADEECLFTQSNVTNAHGGDCGQNTGTDTYGWRSCCRFFPNECGAEGQNCCSGTCQLRLSCNNNVCQPIRGAVCGDGMADPGETCANCPLDVGCITNATVLGYVRNATGDPVGGARVEALNKNITYSNAAGYYELKFGNSTESPYDLVASAAGYESQPVFGFSVPNGVSIQQDFTLVQYRGDCADDCIKVGSNLCSKDCNGKGFCWFYSQQTMDACDGMFGWNELPDGKYVNCCEGKPFSPLKADVSVPCASNVIKKQKIVLYGGKFVKMNILTFWPDLCPAS